MYGSNVQYGYNNNPGTRTETKIVELPLAPVRRTPRDSGGCACMNWHSFGILLSLIAAASLALGVADIVVTYQNYMVGWSCSTMTSQAICDPNNLVWTWVGVGIWASIPVFIFGILAIRRGSNPSTQNNWFEFVAFICGFIFTSAMVIISAIEVYKGAGIYYWMYMSPLMADDVAKASIPIVIACLGFIEHIMCNMAFWDICCCQGQNMTTYHSRPVEMMNGPGPAMGGEYRESSYSSGGGAGPSFPGAFYSSNQRPVSQNYFSGMNNSQQSGANQAYNYFRS